ncbi:ribosomal-protein-serine acetyltransferase [Escherichia coli]|uniref:Ribosomal-protein-serine acetyltransferase n=1 Tax=Escherichia coli TaxID=562 RepID=A0A376U9P9_ECOLX|nr:ribosomal-protein-serine acetyltransferase [Escherichia coli]
MSGGQSAKQPGRFAQWFILEGCLKQAEFLNDAYDDVNLYARIIDS